MENGEGAFARCQGYEVNLDNLARLPSRCYVYLQEDRLREVRGGQRMEV